MRSVPATTTDDPASVPKLTGRDHLAAAAVERPRPGSSLLASAFRLTSSSKVRRGPGTFKGTADGWQEDAWEMFNLVGEQRFLATTLANRLSQARFFVGQINPDDPTSDPEPVEDPELQSILNSFGSTAGGRAQLIQRLGVNLFIAGEAWLVGVPCNLLPNYDPDDEDDEPADPSPIMVDVRPAETDGDSDTYDDETEGTIPLSDLVWFALSVDEVKRLDTDRVQLKVGVDGDNIEVSPDEVYMMRVWRPHPRKAWEADSPTRSSLPVLRELVGLTMHVSAQVDSRLAGAGVFIVPASASRALKASMNIPEDSEEDPFTDALIEAMLTPISDRSNASALVPLVLTVPDDVADKFQHISFATPLDAEARNMREEAIRRLALGEDAPPELLLGTAGMNHWGAWLVREDVVTTHIEPPLALIADALTVQLLQPILKLLGRNRREAKRLVVWYDVSHMITRPNRASDAVTLHTAGAISDEALRDATGFDENDAPKGIAENLDAAATMALDMVQADPSLLVQPGLRAVVTQLRSVLTGGIPDAPVAPPPTPEDLPEVVEEAAIPDTAEADATALESVPVP